MASSTIPAADAIAALKAHPWSPQPEPAKLVHRLLNECLERCSFAARLSQRMLAETGTRMLDWIDHFGITASKGVLPELHRVGYIECDPIHGDAVWNHAAGMFPRMRQLRGTTRHLAIKVDSVPDFLYAQELTDVAIDGEPFAPLRRACVARENNVELWVVERHGTREFDPGAWHRPLLHNNATSV